VDKYATEFAAIEKRTINPLGNDWFLLGYDRSDSYNGQGWPVYLQDFEWACGWYWSGGYVEEPNRGRGTITDIRAHYHFDGFDRLPDTWDGNRLIPGRGCSLFDGFTARIARTPLTEGEVWRLCDLMRQFYALRNAAEVYQYGGHYTSSGRTEAEIDPDMAAKINKHIEDVIIPEVRKLWDTSDEADAEE